MWRCALKLAMSRDDVELPSCSASSRRQLSWALGVVGGVGVQELAVRSRFIERCKWPDKQLLGARQRFPSQVLAGLRASLLGAVQGSGREVLFSEEALIFALIFRWLRLYGDSPRSCDDAVMLRRLQAILTSSKTRSGQSVSPPDWIRTGPPAGRHLQLALIKLQTSR